MAGSAADALTLELLTWIARRPRTYVEAMEAWQTNCPRSPVWEDAVGTGLVQVVREGGASHVTLTERGRGVLATSAAAAR